jgi:hypothetical protein
VIAVVGDRLDGDVLEQKPLDPVLGGLRNQVSEGDEEIRRQMRTFLRESRLPFRLDQQGGRTGFKLNQGRSLLDLGEY